MLLSVVIPAMNEAASLPGMLRDLHQSLQAEGIPHELVLVDDHSTDSTAGLASQWQVEISALAYTQNPGPEGYGRAVRHGLSQSQGDCIAIMMADASDSPADLIRFYQAMLAEDCDCIFGHRFKAGGKAVDYPLPKLLLNRFFNHTVSLCFGLRYTDVTNAFKLYRREVIEGIQPLLSPHFNLTLEMPLKAIIRGFSYRVLPNRWQNRKEGISKLRIREFGSRYLFIFFYCLIERYFARADYRKA